MSQLTIGQVAKILGVNKKTLMRWDESGRFRPTRENVSNIRVYEESVVRDLKFLMDHEKKYNENLRLKRKVALELNPYHRVFLLSSREGEFLDKEEELVQEHKKLLEEFEKFDLRIKILYKRFYISRWDDS